MSLVEGWVDENRRRSEVARRRRSREKIVGERKEGGIGRETEEVWYI